MMIVAVPVCGLVELILVFGLLYRFQDSHLVHLVIGYF